MQTQPRESWRLAGAFLLSCPGLALANVAIPATLDLTGQVADLSTSSFVASGQRYDIGIIPLSSNDLPLTLNEGDSFTATVNLDAGFTVPESPNRFLILDFGYGLGTPSYTVGGAPVVTSTIALFLGAVPVFDTATACGNCVNTVADLPSGAPYTFDRVEATLTVTNLTAPYTIGPSNAALRYQLSQPVPEPGSWALLAGGLAGLGLFVRRRKASTADA